MSKKIKKSSMDNFDYMQIMQEGQELCNELQEYLEDGASFQMLRHPLVYGVPYSAVMNGIYNKQLQVKSAHAEKCLQEKDFIGYIFIHERPWRLWAFEKISEQIGRGDYWKLLSEIWTDSENIWSNKEEWTRLLTARDRISHRRYFMSPDERKEFAAMPDRITVYRGCVKGINEDGFSYTTSPEKAEFFSKRFLHKFRGAGTVIEKAVSKNEVFAYLNRRDESEIILLP